MEDNRLKIGIDVDDVLAAYVPRHRAICQELFGKPLKEGEIIEPSDWAYSNYGLSSAEIAAVDRHVDNTKDFWGSLGKADYSVPSLGAYYASKYRLYFITARRPTKGEPPEIQTAKWLVREFDVPYPTVIVARNKDEVARALQLDAFIDDSQDHCNRVKLACPSTLVCLRNLSHNEAAILAHGIVRVDNLRQFFELVEANLER